MANNKKYDIVIVGGGLVGAVLAVALRNSNFKLAVLESSAEDLQSNSESDSNSNENNLNQRAIVLSKASQTIFHTLGLWESIAKFATPVTDIHVSNKGHFGAVRLNANDQSVDALGYVVVAHHLYQQLRAALATVDVFYDAEFSSLQRKDDCVDVNFICDGVQKITTTLVVAADGSYSSVRTSENMNTHTYDYQQKVMLCNVALQRDHKNIAYERFTKYGPCALLPMSEKTCAVIWATSPADADLKMQLDKQDFINQLQQHFGYRLGKFIDVSKRFVYPLALIKAKQVVKPNVVLVGNAAQTLHPIAGQGLNLGLRDMAALAQLLTTTNKPIGSLSFLNEYAAWRTFDRNHIVGLTHSLVTLFSTDFAPVNLATGAGLLVLERLPQLRKQFARATMGLMGDVPKLACGIEL